MTDKRKPVTVSERRERVKKRKQLESTTVDPIINVNLGAPDDPIVNDSVVTPDEPVDNASFDAPNDPIANDSLDVPDDATDYDVDADNGLLGGPIDCSLLTSFKDHIARSIWIGGKARCRMLKLMNHHKKVKLWTIGEEGGPLRNGIEKLSCMINIAKYGHKFVDSGLLSAFVERWQPETNSFHFSFGEMTITLDDVHQILGVPITGKPLHDLDGGSAFSVAECRKLLVECLGLRKDQEDRLRETRVVTTTWLQQEFKDEVVNTDTPPERVDQLARAYILFLMGSSLFPNKSGVNIPICYVEVLKDLDPLDTWAWGMAILADLYRHLGIATRREIMSMGGCVHLLQAWIFEHFDIGNAAKRSDYNSEIPKMGRWMTTSSNDSRYLEWEGG